MFTNLSCSDLNIHKNDAYIPLFSYLIFDNISAVHFHHFSTHNTYGTRVRIICDFRRIKNLFTAPKTRCLVKCVNSDCLGILRNFTC